MPITEDDLRRAETLTHPALAGECEHGCRERAAFVLISDDPEWSVYYLCEKCARRPEYMVHAAEVYRVAKEPFG